MAEQLKDVIKKEYVKCAQDPAYFMKKYCLFVVLAFLLSGCSTKIDVYETNKPIFIAEEFFNGSLTAHGIDPKEYENKLVYLMSVEKARFRNPVIPDCELHLEIEAVRSHGRVWKYKGTAKVDGKRMADAEWSATIVDRKE